MPKVSTSFAEFVKECMDNPSYETADVVVECCNALIQSDRGTVLMWQHIRDGFLLLRDSYPNINAPIKAYHEAVNDLYDGLSEDGVQDVIDKAAVVCKMYVPGSKDLADWLDIVKVWSTIHVLLDRTSTHQSALTKRLLPSTK